MWLWNGSSQRYDAPQTRALELVLIYGLAGSRLPLMVVVGGRFVQGWFVNQRRPGRQVATASIPAVEPICRLRRPTIVCRYGSAVRPASELAALQTPTRAMSTCEERFATP